MRPESARDPSLGSPQPKLSPDGQRTSHTALRSPSPLQEIVLKGETMGALPVTSPCTPEMQSSCLLRPFRFRQHEQTGIFLHPEEALRPQIQNPQLENAPRTLEGVFKHATPMAWCAWSASSYLFWPLHSPWLKKSLQEREPQSSLTKCLDLSWPSGFFLLRFFQA